MPHFPNAQPRNRRHNQGKDKRYDCLLVFLVPGKCILSIWQNAFCQGAQETRTTVLQWKHIRVVRGNHSKKEIQLSLASVSLPPSNDEGHPFFFLIVSTISLSLSLLSVPFRMYGSLPHVLCCCTQNLKCWENCLAVVFLSSFSLCTSAGKAAWQ